MSSGMRWGSRTHAIFATSCITSGMAETWLHTLAVTAHRFTPETTSPWSPASRMRTSPASVRSTRGNDRNFPCRFASQSHFAGSVSGSRGQLRYDRALGVFVQYHPGGLPAINVTRGIRLRIGHIDVVFLIDVDAAGAAELLPLIEEAAVLIEDLDSAVPAVGHKDPSSGIHRDAVRCDELAGAGTVLTPGLDEFPVFGEFPNAPVALGIMSVADENIAVRRNHDVGRSVEHIRPLAGDASLSERHQDFSIRAELEDLMTLAIFPLCIGDPYITVWCHGHAVGVREHVRAKTLEQLARAIKLEDGRLSSVKSPDIPFGIGIGRNHRAPFDVGGERRPTLNDVVRILLRACGRRRDEDRPHDENECPCRLPCVGHRITSLSLTLPGSRAAQGYHFRALEAYNRT